MKFNALHCPLLGIATCLLLLAGCTDTDTSNVSGKSSVESLAAAADPLLFPKDDFSVETKTVRTAEGDRKVTYHSYKHILYVSNPVDADYQSLDISIPVEIDGMAVDAANAPILLANGVGGYMSFNNKTGGFGMPAGFFPGMGAVDTGVQIDAQGPAGMPAMPEGEQGATQMPAIPIGGQMPAGPSGMGGPSDSNNAVTGKQDLALAAGYVVVEPGCRGRDNQAEDGTYYGKAPAAIVDLKAAVRYIRHNKGILPGNVDWIVSSGCSAGGALSSILGASGDNALYDPYLKQIGAADADDSIFACACFSPVTDLDHADMSYEWLLGQTPLSSGELVDQTLSKELIALFAEYQASLNFQGNDGFGTLTADNYDDYLMQQYLIPSASQYLNSLSESDRTQYLASIPWLTWKDGKADFAFRDYIASTSRGKGLPAFDDFEMEKPEPLVFGDETTDGRHFTDFTLQKITGDSTMKVDSDLQQVVNMMNPMYFIGLKNPGCAKHWWIRAGSEESGLAVTVGNLAAGLENMGRDVDAGFFWDAGHCEDDDPESFIAWIGDITGYAVGN